MSGDREMDIAYLTFIEFNITMILVQEELEELLRLEQVISMIRRNGIV